MSVSIAARALLYDRQAEAGLVGSVFRQDKKKGAVFIDRVTVPIHDYTSDRFERIRALDNAENGSYLVQISLPNGEVKTESFEITEGKDTKLAIDIPHEGPHEWSSLQAMTGQFASDALADPTATAPPVTSGRYYVDLKDFPQQGFALRFLEMDDPLHTGALIGKKAIPSLAKLIGEDVTIHEAGDCLGQGIEVLQPSQEDPEFALFEFVRNGCLGDGADRESYHFGPGTDLTRSYLLTFSGEGMSLICLPAPWTRMGEEADIQLLLDKRMLEPEPDFSMTISDPMINSALGYIRNGALHEAARLIDYSTAEGLLFNKISSPLAATIGGYLLLAGLDRAAYKSRSAEWKDWVDNLCGWFEWLPDGAVLKSAKYFVLGDNDRDEALTALMSAFERGLPFFSFGLNLMVEGMRRFANEGEERAKQRLPVLEAISAVSDSAQDFLTIRVARRWT